jgi:hypothetical protein
MNGFVLNLIFSIIITMGKAIYMIIDHMRIVSYDIRLFGVSSLFYAVH